MSRPREREITPILRHLMALSETDSLEALARKHEINEHTVRTWDKRGAVPDGQLALFAARYGVSIDDLLALRRLSPDAAVEAREPEPASFVQMNPMRADLSASERARLALAIDVVMAGLRAQGVDESKVPTADMAADLFRRLPWPVPRKP